MLQGELSSDEGGHRLWREDACRFSLSVEVAHCTSVFPIDFDIGLCDSGQGCARATWGTVSPTLQDMLSVAPSHLERHTSSLLQHPTPKTDDGGRGPLVLADQARGDRHLPDDGEGVGQVGARGEAPAAALALPHEASLVLGGLARASWSPEALLQVATSQVAAIAVGQQSVGGEQAEPAAEPVARRGPSVLV